MGHKIEAIVTDGLWRKSLSAIRSLGKAGFEVTVMGDTLFTTGFWSRFCSKRVTAPLASRDADGFGAALLKDLESSRAAGRAAPVILPMEDPSLLWVTRNRARLEGLARLLLPSEEALEIASDKGRTLRVARELGLPCPETHEPASAGEFASHCARWEKEGRSFAVKPRTGTGSAGVKYSGADADWKAHWDKYGAMLLQERIPAHGHGQGVSLLMRADGECVAAFAHERLQQYPNSGGPSTDRHGIYAPELVARSIALLKKLGWRGIAMVEWKIDPRDGVAKLMEINPRFWGSLELAVRSGVDFPALYARAAMGERVAPVLDYRAGVRCRWMIPGEVLRYVTQMRSEREGLLGFLRGLPGSAEEWDWRDLRGTLAVVACTAALALNPRYWKYVRR